MTTSTQQNGLASLRNNRILRRAIIPASYHNAAKLMARSLEIPVGEVYDQAVENLLSSPPARDEFVHVGRKNNPPKISFWLDAHLSKQAKKLAAELDITEHEVLLTAIHAFAKLHRFDSVKT